MTNEMRARVEAAIEVLTEKAAAVVVAETVEVLAAIVTVANKTNAVRKAVATLANKLRKLIFIGLYSIRCFQTSMDVYQVLYRAVALLVIALSFLQPYESVGGR